MTHVTAAAGPAAQPHCRWRNRKRRRTPLDLDYDVAAIIGAGLLAGLIMLVPLYMGRAMAPQQMRMDLLRLLGTMTPMRLATPMAYMAGAMMHAGASVFFAFAHIGIFELTGVNNDLVAWGLLFGVFHWLIVGMALGMMPLMHPRIADGELENPGPFALAMGPMTAMGFLMLHLLFGVVLAALYEAFI